MKIIVCGCGKIGKSILESLVRERHRILVLDTDRELLDSISESYDVMTLCGSGVSCETLRRAGAGSAELFIAATGSDEVNMLSCIMAGRMGAEHTVARISDREHSTKNADFLKRELGISMLINPELLTAQTVRNYLSFPSAVKSESFARRRFEMVELCVRQDSILNGAVLSFLRSRLGVPFLVCCVLRQGRAYIPKGDFTLTEGDRIGLLAAPEDMHTVLRFIGILGKRSRNVMILGGSRTAQYLAGEISKGGGSLKIIERDRHRCDALCSELPGSVSVICGDGSRNALLSEEGLEHCDAFIALTGEDEENLLSSYYALDRGVPKIITKVSEDGFAEIGEKLGLDCVVSPRRITADAVTQYARALGDTRGSRIETLYSLMDGSIEALEFTVTQELRQTGVQIKDMKIKQGVLLAGIIRGSGTLIPTGSDVLLPGDRVIVIAAEGRPCELSDVLL